LLRVQHPAKVVCLSQVVPNIYAVPPDAPRVPIAGRLLALGLAVGCLAVLITAARMPPSPRGFGTHSDQLGLPPCNFFQITGIPCPSCGMTTSFSWFVRGNLLASLYVQPMGTILAALAAASVWGGLYVAVTGRPAHRLLRLIPARYTLFPLLLLGILAWGWKILIHLNGVDGWGT
jgi:hypothetical protein